MLSPALSFLLLLLLLVTTLPAVLLAYLIIRYIPIIAGIFQEKPRFLPLRVPAREEGEDVRFTTADGLQLAGTYLPARSRPRAGVLVFCHEFLSDRWSYQPYCDAFRDLGFDIFTFDFRNHGTSDSDSVYQPLQWVSDHEVRDLEAALAWLRARPDHDPAGFALYGISRGGGTALVVASGERDVWGLVTDGTFPTSGTMLTYILRWAEIFVKSRLLYAVLRDFAPRRLFSLLGWLAQRRTERCLSCRYPSIERAAARLSPRPWLMIHGEKDSYIGPDIARRLFALAGEPKELWIVPGAKHNRCRDMDPAAYFDRVESFLGRFAPRGARAAETPAGAISPVELCVSSTSASDCAAESGAKPVAEAEVGAPAESHAHGLTTSVIG